MIKTVIFAKIGHFCQKRLFLSKSSIFVKIGHFVEKWPSRHFGLNFSWRITDFYENNFEKFHFFAFNSIKNVQSWPCLRLCPVGFFFLECCAPINILKCNYLRFFSLLAVNILLWWLYIVMTKMNIKIWPGHP